MQWSVSNRRWFISTVRQEIQVSNSPWCPIKYKITRSAGAGECEYSDRIMVTFSSLLQKASNFPNIYISETSKDFSPDDSKICFLVLWKDVWYSLNRKMQSYEKIKRRRKEVMRICSGVNHSRISCRTDHTSPSTGAVAVDIKLKFSTYILKSGNVNVVSLNLHHIFILFILTISLLSYPYQRVTYTVCIFS